MKIAYYEKKWPHHAKNSGYSILFRDLEILNHNIYRIPPYTINLSTRALQKFKRLVSSLWVTDRKKLELNSINNFIKKNKIDFLHISSFEDLHYLKNISCRRLLTIHHPPLKYKINKQILSYLREDDILILVSESQQTIFSEYPNRTVIIPHPIDTEFYKPSIKIDDKYTNNESFRFVMAGAYLRDYILLLEIVKKAKLKGLNFYLDIIFPKRGFDLNPPLRDIFDRLATYENINFHISVSDDKLKEVYQSAHAGLLPLIDATANNSLLEMLAMGLPIITSNNGGTRFYLSNSENILAENNSDSFIKGIESLISNKSLCINVGKKNMIKAHEDYSISAVQELYVDFLKTLKNYKN